MVRCVSESLCEDRRIRRGGEEKIKIPSPREMREGGFGRDLKIYCHVIDPCE